MDLFSDLPPAAGEANTPAPSKANKPAAPSGWLMPPPIRRPQPRPSGSTALGGSKPLSSSSQGGMKPPQSTSPRTDQGVLSPKPIDIHASISPGPSPLDDISNTPKVEVYDPARPNDYMAYCAERVQRKKEEEAKKELEKYMKAKEEEQRRIAEERSRAGNAFPPAGRGRGRGVSNLPAWMVAGQGGAGSQPSAEGGQGPEEPKKGAFEDAEPPGGARGKGGIGSMLLAKMGYKEGSGLGKEEQGITQAIRHRPTGGGQGMISGPRPSSSSSSSSSSMAPPPPAPSSDSAAAEAGRRRKRGLFSNPSRVLLLKNMVGPGEVDEDLQAETAEECQKFGPVKECVVHELHDESLPEEERVLTYVFFEKQESAVKAYVEMGGRFFGGRQIQTSFFDEDKFNARDLVPSRE